MTYRDEILTIILKHLSRATVILVAIEWLYCVSFMMLGNQVVPLGLMWGIAIALFLVMLLPFYLKRIALND